MFVLLPTIEGTPIAQWSYERCGLVEVIREMQFAVRLPLVPLALSSFLNLLINLGVSVSDGQS